MTTDPKPESGAASEIEPSRRKLFKRLAALAAAGYTAPKAVLISDAWACHTGDTSADNVPPPGKSVC